MSRKSCLAIIGLLFVMVLINVPVNAQQDTSAPQHRHMLTTNPFLILFSWWNVEYEFKLAPHSTIGFAGSYSVFGENDENEDNTKYMGGYLIYRYYPSAKAHAGFFFGGRFGMTGVEIEYSDGSEKETGTAYGFGIEVGYTWLLGQSEMFAISLGTGATKLFGSDLEDDTAFLPIIRLVNIGVAF